MGYVSVFNPISPTGDTMTGSSACYRLESGSQECPGEMFGANAPGSTWHMTFDQAALGPVTYFVPVPGDSPFNSQGNGQVVIQPKKPKTGNGGGGHGGGGGNGGGGRRRRQRRRRNGGGGNGGGGRRLTAEAAGGNGEWSTGCSGAADARSLRGRRPGCS